MQENNIPTPDQPVGDVNQSSEATAPVEQPSNHQPNMASFSPAPSLAPTPLPVVPPQVPMAQPTPTTTPQPIVATPPVPVQSSHKGLWIGLIIAGAVLLIIGAVMIGYFVLFAVSKADYQKSSALAGVAQKQYDSLDSDGTSLSKVATDTESTDAELSAAKVKYTAAVSTYRQKVAAVKDSRAMLDSKAKQKYDAFAVKNDEILKYNESMAASMSSLHATLKDCNSATGINFDSTKIDQLVAQYDKALGPCNAAISTLTKAPNADVTKVAIVFKKYYADMRSAVTDVQTAYIAKSAVTYQKAYKTLASMSLNDSPDFKAVTSSISKHTVDLDPKSALTDLRTYLDKQS